MRGNLPVYAGLQPKNACASADATIFTMKNSEWYMIAVHGAPGLRRKAGEKSRRPIISAAGVDWCEQRFDVGEVEFSQRLSAFIHQSFGQRGFVGLQCADATFDGICRD